MSFLTDLAEGNFGNLSHDLTAHWQEDAPYWLGGAAALTGGLGLAGIGPAAGLFGAGEAAAGAGAEGGLSALGFAGEAAPETGSLAGWLGAPDAVAGGTGELAPEISNAYASVGGIGSDTVAGANLSTGFDPTLENAFTGLGADSEGLGTQADFAGGSGGEKSFLGDLWQGAKSSVTKNPLGIAAAGAGLGLNFLKGNAISEEQQKLKNQASQLGAQGQQLMSYLSSGTLPPALKAQLDQATAAAKARIVSNHAKSGMPTDPSQNSALAQELNAVDMNAVSAMADAQIKMMQTGLSETGLSTQLYEMLVKMDSAQNHELLNAIASFASALGGGYGGQKKAA